jgi:transposase
MAGLLCEGLAAAKAARATGGTDGQKASLPKDVVADIEAKFDDVIALGKAEYAKDPPVPKKCEPEGVALLARLEAYRDNHLLFLHDLDVPFDNNVSERLLRGVKKKIKQTGGFRSLEHGQEHYCGYLSIAQSAAARDMEVLGVVAGVFAGKKGILAAHDALVQASGP